MPPKDALSDGTASAKANLGIAQNICYVLLYILALDKIFPSSSILISNIRLLYNWEKLWM